MKGCGLSDQVVFAGLNMLDHAGAIFQVRKLHPVAYGYRVGGNQPLDTEFAFNTTWNYFLFRFYRVPATGRFYD